jgi:hypothetical protein
MTHPIDDENEIQDDPVPPSADTVKEAVEDPAVPDEPAEDGDAESDGSTRL